MKKIMMFCVIVSMHLATNANNEAFKQNIKEIVCAGPYQTFENFPSFDKSFVLNPEFLHFDPNIFHTRKIVNTNYRIVSLLPWQWYNVQKIVYSTEQQGKKRVLQEVKVDTTKLSNYCPRVIHGNLVQIEVEISLKKEDIKTVFDPHIIHRIFELLKIEKQNINPSKRIVGRFAQPELVGFGLKIFSLEILKSFNITAETISTLMSLEPNTIMRLIRYIQNAYYDHVMIIDDESLYKWLKDKKILNDVLRRKFTNTYDLIQQKKIAISPKDVAMINKLNAYYEAGAIWKAIEIIADVAGSCASAIKK